MDIIFAVSVMLLLLLLFFLGPALERHQWNGGKCREHGRYWIYFDTDSQGGRGYKCEERWTFTKDDEHGRKTALTCSTWISYSGIDR